MVDFRYHLVSLISVFLALAVGIALGAGPLEATIGDQLTGQVDLLREEKDALRAELDVADARVAAQETFIDGAGDGLLDGVLDGRRVAVVQVGEPSAEMTAGVVERVEQSGATVVGTVAVTEEWTTTERRAFRQSLAGSLVQYLDPVPAVGASTEAILAQALAQALVAPDPADVDLRAERAEVLEQLLVEAGLITVEDDGVTLPADAVVVVATNRGPLDDVEPEVVEGWRAEYAAYAQIAFAAQHASTGAVVATDAPSEVSMYQAIRDDSVFASALAVVESADAVPGQISVPLALSARISGVVASYGFAAHSTSVIPPHVVLPPIERVPQVLPEPTEDATAPEDGDDGTAPEGEPDGDGGEPGADAGGQG